VSSSFDRVRIGERSEEVKDAGKGRFRAVQFSSSLVRSDRNALIFRLVASRDRASRTSNSRGCTLAERLVRWDDRRG
jgi:hypothetical protein